jgi:hypothetical protein
MPDSTNLVEANPALSVSKTEDDTKETIKK